MSNARPILVRGALRADSFVSESSVKFTARQLANALRLCGGLKLGLVFFQAQETRKDSHIIQAMPRNGKPYPCALQNEDHPSKG